MVHEPGRPFSGLGLEHIVLAMTAEILLHSSVVQIYHACYITSVGGNTVIMSGALCVALSCSRYACMKNYTKLLFTLLLVDVYDET